MALNVKAGSFTAKTGTGSDAITGIGFLPKILFLFFIDATSAGSSVNFRNGWGAYDGTTSACCGMGTDDGSNSAQSRASNTKCISIIDASGTLLAEASGSSLDSDGFTLNWSTAGAGELVGYLAIGGSDLTDVDIQTFQYGAGTNYTNSSMSFAADCLIFGGIDEAWGSGGNAAMGWGAALSTTERFGGGMRDRNGQAPSTSSSSGYRTSRCFIPGDDSTTPNIEIDITAIASNGFSLTKDVDAAYDPAMFAVAMAGPTFDIGADTTKTSTGTKATTTSDQPDAILLMSSCHDTSEGFEQPSRFQIGAATGSAEEINVNGACAGSTDHDQNISTTKCLEMHDAGTPTLLSSAQLDSFNATDFTLDYTTSDGNGYYFGWLSITAAAVGGATGKSNPLFGPLGGPFVGVLA